MFVARELFPKCSQWERASEVTLEWVDNRVEPVLGANESNSRPLRFSCKWVGKALTTALRADAVIAAILSLHASSITNPCLAPSVVADKALNMK